MVSCGFPRPAEHAKRPVRRRPAACPGGLPLPALPQLLAAYLAHLFRSEELLAYRLATCHNLTFTLDFMAEIRSQLRSGTFAAGLPELRATATPSRSSASAVQSQ